MVKLTSSLHAGKNCRTVDEFDRPLNGVSYQNFHRPSLSLALPATERERENPKARNHRLSLDQLDLEQLCNYIFNPVGKLTLGQITNGNFEEDASLRFIGRVAKNVGLPLNKFIARVDNSKDYYILAVNIDHANEQLKRLFKDRVGAVVLVEEFNCG
jgi:hypothetical protein